MQCLFNRTNDCICASSRNEGTVFNDGIFRMDGPAAVQMDGVDLWSVAYKNDYIFAKNNYVFGFCEISLFYDGII